MKAPPPVASTCGPLSSRRAITRASPARKSGSPWVAKISGIGHAGRLLDLGVGIDERDAEPQRQPPADRRLAGAHHADQHDRARARAPPRAPARSWRRRLPRTSRCPPWRPSACGAMPPARRVSGSCSSTWTCSQAPVAQDGHPGAINHAGIEPDLSGTGRRSLSAGSRHVVVSPLFVRRAAERGVAMPSLFRFLALGRRPGRRDLRRHVRAGELVRSAAARDHGVDPARPFAKQQ